MCKATIRESFEGKPTCSLQLGLGELINGQALNNFPLASFAFDWEGEDDVLQSNLGGNLGLM